MEQCIENLDENFDDVKQNIRRIKKLKGSSRDEMEKKINEIFSETKSEIKKYEKLYNNLKGDQSLIASDQNEWDREVKKHKKKLKKYAKDYKSQKGYLKASLEESKKNELLVMAEEEDDKKNFEKKRLQQKIKRGEELSNDDLSNQLFKEVFKLQDENIELVNALLDKADKANELGADIAEDILEQNEILKGIKVDLDTLQGTIIRARKELTSFMRGLATDKLIIVCLCLCICTILVAVFLLVVCEFWVCKLICDAIKQQEKIPGIYK